MVKKYVKKPVKIEALEIKEDNIDEIHDFVTDNNCEVITDFESYTSIAENKTKITSVVIHTLEGDMTASVGDYIVKGVEGEFYFCKRDIFHKTYDEVSSNKNLIDSFIRKELGQ